ncbi:hypothetical protein ACI48J_13575 [Paenibacillus chitinolyticus]|uniref:hypothetical protein n=1 Tax=Paenibacillus chitinolyticus TaxID=79263 RepID=UPI00386E3047
MAYSISRTTRHGWMDVSERILPAPLLKKRIIIETLDERGEVIAASEAAEVDKDSFLALLFAKYGPAFILKELHPKLFSEEEFEYAVELIELEYDLIPSHDNIMEIRALFDAHGHNKVKLAQDMACGMSAWGDGYFMVTPKNPYFRKMFTFEEALEFINKRKGLYYAIDKLGNRRYDFIDEPTKKQITYQQNKNGNQVVFLSFADWKLHKV